MRADEITDDGEVDLGDCPYFARYANVKWADPHGICVYGCQDEPKCVTCEPKGGWPSFHAMIDQ